jgi:folate-binding protein YgfZ
MTAKSHVVLENRGLLEVSGEDRTTFLQGLVSNDVTKAGPGRALYSAFLTPQGKYLHDFFIAERDGAFLLDCEGGERLASFHKRLTLYKLRSKAAIADRSADLAVIAVFGDGAAAALGLPEAEAGASIPFAGGVAFVDPRLAAAGARVLAPRAEALAALSGLGIAEAAPADYDVHRIGLGLPDGSRDLHVERSILLENGFEELNGVSFDKGCYMGQELTARTKHRALIRKRLMPVTIEGPTPEPGTAITLDGEDAGEMHSASGSVGLAMIRLESLEKGRALTCGEARLTPRKPDWANF